MTTYRITSPRRQGERGGKPFYVVDIVHYEGGLIARRTTIPQTVAERFVKAVFGDDDR